MRYPSVTLRRTTNRLAIAALAGMAAIGAAIYAGQAATSVPGPADTQIIQPTRGFADLVELVRPAVVNISARSLQPASFSKMNHRQGPSEPRGFDFNGPPQMREFMERFFSEQYRGSRPGPSESRSLGSGFIVDPSGLVVTNHHVIKGADNIEVILDDGTTLEATIKGVDPRTDLALLQVNSESALPYVGFGDSDAARVGDWVIAIGNPFGLGGTTTSGIVSARGRDLRDGPYVDYIQIDAPINRGNSGGPLFNEAGEVIGINTAIFSPNGGSVGIGFAIPSAQAKVVIDQLRDKGAVARAWLGVQIQPLTQEIAAGLGLGDTSGALVSRITPDSPAAKSNLQSGDVILAFNQAPVKKMRDLPRLVAHAPTGTNAKMKVWRDGETIEIEARLESMAGTMQAAYAEEDVESNGRLGLRLAEIDDEMRKASGLEHDGVIVQEVDPMGPAAREGLQAGDIILKVGSHSVSTPGDVVKEVQSLQAKDQKRPIVLLVQRGDDRRFVAVKTG